MTKYRYFLDTEREAKWLNEMSGKGYALTGFCMGFYSFDRCQPGEYVYQIDFTEGMFSVSTDYREFMAETGVEIVCLWGPWVFLRKKACEGEFRFYTDAESSVQHYTKVRNFFKGIVLLDIICLLVNMPGALLGIASSRIGMGIIALCSVPMIAETMRLGGILKELKIRMGENNG